MNQDKKFTVRCRGIIVHEGKLLVVRHAHNSSYAALPGGHLEWGENMPEALTRELIEELGVAPQIGRLLYTNTFVDSERSVQPIEFFFEVTNAAEYLNLTGLERTHAHELAEVVWISPTDECNLRPEKLREDFARGALFAPGVRHLQH